MVAELFAIGPVSFFPSGMSVSVFTGADML
jgi:hypothetical protein